MAKIVFLNVDNAREVGHDFAVEAHGPNCGDIKQKVRKGAVQAGGGDYADQRAAFLDYNADFIEDGGEEDAWAIKFFPCAGLGA